MYERCFSKYESTLPGYLPVSRERRRERPREALRHRPRRQSVIMSAGWQLRLADGATQEAIARCAVLCDLPTNHQGAKLGTPEPGTPEQRPVYRCQITGRHSYLQLNSCWTSQGKRHGQLLLMHNGHIRAILHDRSIRLIARYSSCLERTPVSNRHHSRFSIRDRNIELIPKCDRFKINNKGNETPAVARSLTKEYLLPLYNRSI